MTQDPDTSAQIRPLAGNRGRHRHDVPDSPLLEKEQKSTLHNSLELLHGHAEVDFEKDELVVLVVLRDGRPYIKSFVEHYFALGAKHIVFLDNGSEDGTIEALEGYERGVTVFRTGLPFKHYQISMRQYLVERFGRERWTLSVDIDELFDYPYSDVVSLKALLGYLNERRYTAVVAQMLDMFPEAISSEETSVSSDEPLKKLNRYYDTSDVITYDYDLFEDTAGNEASNGGIKVLQGGVHKRLFDQAPMLTKHPLVFLGEGVKPVDMSEHWVGGARLADFTGLLMHYKLSVSLYGLVSREIEKRTYPNRHGKYDNYLKVLERAPRLVLKDETSRELLRTDDLLGTPFVVLSEEYMRFVGREDLKRGGTPEGHARRLFDAFLSASSEARAQASAANRLRREKRTFARRVQREKNGRKQAQQQVDRLREEIAAVQSSRAWRVLGVLSRGKIAVMGAIAFLGSRDAHGHASARPSSPRGIWLSGRESLRNLKMVRDVKAYLYQGPGVARGPLPEARSVRSGDRKPVQAPMRPQGRQDREPRASGANAGEVSPVFFIVGSGKSGTTWLMRLFNAHPEVLCLGEGRLFNREWHREDLGHVDARVPPRTLYGALSNSWDLRLWMERSVWGRNENTEELLAGMTHAVVDYFLKRKLAKSGKRIVGDKTPFLPGVNLMKEVKEIYPEAKVVHIIRDGRDVEVSWLHHKWNRSTDRGGVQILSSAEAERRDAYHSNNHLKITEMGMFDEAELRRRARLWSEHVGGAVEYGPELLDGNYIEVKYENLLADTAKELKRLLGFLGAESSDDTVRQCVEKASFESLSGGRQRGEEDSSAFLRKGIAGDWKNVFTEKDRRIFEEEAGSLLEKLGYEKATTGSQEPSSR